MVEHQVGIGDVPLMIDDEEFILKPSWGAAQLVSQRFGGISGAVEKVIRLDIEATVQIVMFGMGFVGTRKPPLNLAERIWRAGLTDRTGGVAEACVKYLHVLANGGRPPPEDDEAEEGAEKNPSTKPSTTVS